MVALLVVTSLWLRDSRRDAVNERAQVVARLIGTYAGALSITDSDQERGDQAIERSCENAADFAVEAFEDVTGKKCEDVTFTAEFIKEAPDELPDCDGAICDVQVTGDGFFVVTIE